MLSSREVRAALQRQSTVAGRSLFLFDPITTFLAPILPFHDKILKYCIKIESLPDPNSFEQSRLRGICLEPSRIFSYYDFNHTALHIFSAWFDPCFPGLHCFGRTMPQRPGPGPSPILRAPGDGMESRACRRRCNIALPHNVRRRIWMYPARATKRGSTL